MPTFLHLNVVISCRRPPSTLMLLIQGYPLEQVKIFDVFLSHDLSWCDSIKFACRKQGRSSAYCTGDSITTHQVSSSISPSLGHIFCSVVPVHLKETFMFYSHKISGN